MKRRMSAHDDRSDVSEHADVSGPMSVPPSTSRTERHVLSMHENRTQQSDDSRLGALRGSLPSPPLCEEVPFMVAGCDYAEQSCEVLGAAERDNLRISGQELTLPMRTDGSPGQSSVISRDDTSSHAAHSAHSAGRQGLEPTFVHMLRSTHAVMRQGLAESKVSADDVIAAQELLQSMGTMITEKLRSRIRPRAGVK
ncbi:hypothetical protein BC835DRAFT_1086449 [Cytidiella melzeri]|nr:hypothetical protein BC835DRAFT_1086449 [Cytidiella melzeri]